MDPSTIETGKFLLELGAVAALYVKIRAAMREMTGKGESREISNNPLHVQSTSRPATMDDLKPISERLEILEKNQSANAAAIQVTSHDNGEKIDDLRDRMDDKLTSITEELRELGRSVGRLEGS